MKMTVYAFCVLLALFTKSLAQPGANELLYQKALKAREEYKYQEGLALMQLILKSDSSNVDYLTQTSYFLSRVGQLQPNREGRMAYYRKAEYIAIKAVTLGPENGEAHYSYALALGRINEHASNKQKIANAKLIKGELDACLKQNPKHDLAWHIMGRMDSELAALNGMERLAINTLYGGVPTGGSYSDAIICFQNAVKYNPKYMTHYFELAKVFKARGNKGDRESAILTLKEALQLTNIAPDDVETRKNCETLLKKLE